MRYLGNKTRLLRFIGRVLRTRGIITGRAVDPFCGTGSVAHALKRWGFSVAAGDIMEYGRVLAAAQLGPPGEHDVNALVDALGVKGGVRRVLAYLNRLPGKPSFVHEYYSPAGAEGARTGRMYFTPENAARIDAVRCTLHEWQTRGLLSPELHDLLLASLIEAADRVANTTGVYAAFVKTWQPNAVRPLTLRLPPRVRGEACSAVRADAVELVRATPGAELLYLDPPYNNRQYAGYYHIPEVIACGWFEETPRTRGKTGLIEDRHKRSDWSSSRRCEAALEQLLGAADCRHVVMSYNAEGMIPEQTIERVLRAWGKAGTFRRYQRDYRRYRSDSDSETRNYRGDEVTEYLYCVERA